MKQRVEKSELVIYRTKILFAVENITHTCTNDSRNNFPPKYLTGEVLVYVHILYRLIYYHQLHYCCLYRTPFNREDEILVRSRMYKYLLTRHRISFVRNDLEKQTASARPNNDARLTGMGHQRIRRAPRNFRTIFDGSSIRNILYVHVLCVCSFAKKRGLQFYGSVCIYVQSFSLSFFLSFLLSLKYIFCCFSLPTRVK